MKMLKKAYDAAMKAVAVMLHPRKFIELHKRLEMEVLLGTACLALEIEDPSIWDVDRLHSAVNKLLEMMHADKGLKSLADELKNAKKCLKWTRLVSKAVQMKVSRDSIRKAIREHELMAGILKEKGLSERPTTGDIAAMYGAFIDKFYVCFGL